MPDRPERDRVLDVGTVRRTLREQCPEIGLGRVELIGSGWATDVYRVNNGTVARFPKNAELARWVDSDAAVLRFVAESLDGAFPIPRLLFQGEAGEFFPYGFLVCEYVPGVGAGTGGAPAHAGLAAALGRALQHIHAVSIAEARGAGIGDVEYEAFAGRGCCFLHGDFWSDNILLDPKTGQFVGLIDWGNAAIGDPVLDFVPLVLWRGWRFTRSVLAAYDGNVGAEFLERLRWKAQVRASEWLADSVRRRKDPAEHLSWVQNAFAMYG